MSKFSAQYLPQLRSEQNKTWQTTRAPDYVCRESENLVALGRSVREGGALKFTNFEKVRMFGAT